MANESDIFELECFEKYNVKVIRRKDEYEFWIGGDDGMYIAYATIDEVKKLKEWI